MELAKEKQKLYEIKEILVNIDGTEQE